MDLLPGTVMELEEENPFLQLGNEIEGQYSLPLTAPLTDKNMRLLGNPNLLQIKKPTTGIEADLFTEGVQHSRGQIKIEAGSSNINQPQRGSISIYYLFGVSDFYKLVEGKKLSDINYGADYVKPMSHELLGTDIQNPDYFWGFMNQVMNDGTPFTHEFAIFPVINEADPGYRVGKDFDYNMLNSMGIRDSNQNSVLNYRSYGRAVWFNNVCPFPYLRFVLDKVFQHFGWTIQGTILNDSDFRKIVILHNRNIPYEENLAAPYPDVVFNMRDHVPRVSVSSFLIGLQNRFGWWFDFDFRKKVCTIKARNDILKTRTPKDYTLKAAAQFSFNNNVNGKVYALREAGGFEKPDFSRLTNMGVIYNQFQLPAAAADKANQLYFVAGENAWYACENVDEVFEWTKLADNTYDHGPAGHNEEITTICLATGSEFLEIISDLELGVFASPNPTGRYFSVPVANLSDDSETFYLCYHHAKGQSVNNTGLPNFSVCQSGAGCESLTGVQLATKSLSFEYIDSIGDDRGLYKNNWEYFLNLLKQTEEVTIPIDFNITDLLNLSYTDTLLIRNVEYFIKNPHIILPLKSFSNMELVRV